MPHPGESCADDSERENANVNNANVNSASVNNANVNNANVNNANVNSASVHSAHDRHAERRPRLFRLETGAQSVQRDVDEEMEFHLAMRAQKLARFGLPPDAAREEALKQFGDFSTVRTECVAINREHHRAMNRVNRWQDLKQDITYAVRSLGNNKGFAAVTILILALGIGANTAMFSLIDVMLLRSLPVPHAEELVTIGNPNRVGAVSQGSMNHDLFSYALYKDVRDGTKSLNGVYAT
ncbi:MAG: permease prefix domain 1-containing protein, partial [Gemmatimonadaceae bacterium]